METIIKLKKLIPEAAIPSKAHPQDVGFDVVCTSVEYDEEHDYYICHTGLAFESDYGICELGIARSSVRDTAAYLANSIGLIDTATYRGEVAFTYKLDERLDAMVERIALRNYLGLSIWKRLFHAKSSYLKCVEQTRQYMIDTALSRAPYARGERCGQLVFIEHPHVDLELTDNLSRTTRGIGGHGSTGK